MSDQSPSPDGPGDPTPGPVPPPPAASAVPPPPAASAVPPPPAASAVPPPPAASPVPPPPAASAFPPPPAASAVPPAAGPLAAPTAYAAGGYNPNLDPEARSRLLAGLLGIFLGAWGVHRFYLGYTSIGIIQIVVTILTCGVGGLWGLVEGIMILLKANPFNVDATGRPLKE